MELFLLFVVMVLAAPLLLFAMPVIMYLVPLMLIGLVISILLDRVRHHSRAVTH